MAVQEHVERLLGGVEAWNAWRDQSSGVKPDLNGLMFTGKAGGRVFAGAKLAGADLSGSSFERIDFSRADLGGVDLRKTTFVGCQFTEAKLTPAKGPAYFRECNLYKADVRGGDFREFSLVEVDASWAAGADAIFSDAKLKKVDFSHADLCRAHFDRVFAWQCRFFWADLTGADLSEAKISETNLDLAKLARASLTKAQLKDSSLSGSDVSGANLRGADLTRAKLVGTRIDGADFHGCRVYGASVWDLRGEARDQTGLVITPSGSASAVVDELEVAQFIYLIRDSKRVRGIIDALTGRAVLIIGRFTSERLAVLEAIATELRKRREIPIIFNFDEPVDRNTTETIRTLAGLCKIVIADLTDPKSTPYESHVIAPDFAIPFFPIIQQGQSEFAMFSDLYDYDWVLEGFEYRDQDHLVANLDAICKEAENKREEIRQRRLTRKRGFRKQLADV